MKAQEWTGWKSLQLIVGSLLFISLPACIVTKLFFFKSVKQTPKVFITKIVQTGPQKEGLKSAFFAELLALASDRPQERAQIDLKAAKNKLLAHPVIENVELSFVGKEALYIDYVSRQPVALIKDFSNLAVDRFGYVFPIKPFFPPKKLPSLYFGAAPFGSEPQEKEKPTIAWGTPLQGPCMELAFKLLEVVSQEEIRSLFEVKTLDVSHAFSQSLGREEVVLEIEEMIPFTKEGKTVQVPQIRYLRLPVKNSAKALGNYLKLREKLLEDETLFLQKSALSTFCKKKPVIDLRIEKMGYIQD